MAGQHLSSCRGILISGVTNLARTQIAEALLRYLTGDRLAIVSGGVHLGTGIVHPMVSQVLSPLGLSVSELRVHTLESVRRQRCTFDVLISIDMPFFEVCAGAVGGATDRRSTRYQKLALTQKVMMAQKKKLYGDEALFPSMPSHWAIGLDPTDAMLRTELWSPSDPRIAHENSTRKFQDNLYEGEPLFTRLQLNTMRKDIKLSERWDVPELSASYAAESYAEQLQRFVQAKDDLHERCMRLVRRLEVYYGESLLINTRKGKRVGE